MIDLQQRTMTGMALENKHANPDHEEHIDDIV